MRTKKQMFHRILLSGVLVLMQIASTIEASFADDVSTVNSALSSLNTSVSSLPNVGSGLDARGNMGVILSTIFGSDTKIKSSFLPVNGASAWTVNGSNLYVDDTSLNVGIGTASPGAKLDVNWGANIGGTMWIKTSNDNAINFQTLDNTWLYTNWIDKDGVRKAWMGLDGTLSWFKILPQNGLTGINVGNSIFVKSDENIGIGTTNPRSKLDVWGGDLMITGTDTNGTAYITSRAGVAYYGNNSYSNGIAINSAGNVGIGTTSIDQALIVNGNIQSGNTGNNGNFYLGGPNVSLRSAYSNNALGIYTANTERIRIDGNGNVGIGNDNPSYKLDVTGTANVSGNTNIGGSLGVSGGITAGGGILGAPYIGAQATSNEGGRLRVINNQKTGNLINDWSIWNMTGGYGNALKFWRYAADGTNPGPSFTLWDTGGADLTGNLNVGTINGGTPITSSNIGSQSVAYATSAGNADTVDGLHASSFAMGVAGVTQNNFNTIKQPGLYHYDGGLSNTPNGSPNYRSIEIGADGRYSQIALPWDSDKAFLRRKTDSTWYSWVEFITSANIGSQSVNYATTSGNADTVDGYHANSFAIKNSSWNPRGTNLWGGFNLNGGEAVFSETSGQMTLSLDGTVYVDGGQYPVISSGNIGSQSVAYATSAGNASYATTAGTSPRTTIEDTRAAQRTPNDYDDYRTSFEFTNQITGLGGWQSAMTMQGWTNGYTAWQIVGPSSTTANENWYLRSGVNTSWNPVRTIIHSGNIGSQSVNYATSAGNADTVDGYHVGSLLKWNTWENGNYFQTDGNIYMAWAGNWIASAMRRKDVADTSWNVNYFGSNKGASSYVGGQDTYGLEAYSTDGGAAGMSFHRGGYYAVNMGLDPDNVLRIGGWSAGANRWQLDMSGNETLAGSSYAQSFRDTNDGTYYIDPNGSSQIGTIYANNWFRAQGNSGLYFQDYGGGFHMTDSSWVRVYNGKSLWTDNEMWIAGNGKRLAFNTDSSTDNTPNASIYGIQNGINGASADLVFKTWNGAADTEIMRLRSNGSVGIGRSDPQTMLHLYRNYENSNSEIRIEATSTTGNFNDPGIRMISRVADFKIFANDDSNELLINNGSAVRFAMRGDNGYIGIGYWAGPLAQYPLDIAASMRVSGGNATGGGIKLADDGDIVDMNDGYASMRFSAWVRIYSGNSGGSPVIRLGSDGVINANAYYYNSDSRLKHDITSLSSEDTLSKLRQINPVTFSWNYDNREDVGFIAQEVEKVFPTLVKTSTENGMKSVQYGNLVAPAIAGIKALDEKQTSLEAQVATLQAENIVKEEENKKLQEKVSNLENRISAIEKLLAK